MEKSTKKKKIPVVSSKTTKTTKAVKIDKIVKSTKLSSPKSSSTNKKPEKKIEKEKYFESVGRRKSSRARIRLFTQGEKDIEVNNKPLVTYFPTEELQKIVRAPLDIIKSSDKFRIQIKVRGGGVHSQAEAMRHGIARALVVLNPYFRKRLKKAGYLTRDARVRERKKFGLKRARRAPQWSKR